jgi:4-alpha-glucanotransferase
MKGSKSRAAGVLRSNSWGVDLNYEDALGCWHDVPDKTIEAALASMGADGRARPSNGDPVLFAGPPGRFEPECSGLVRLEDGGSVPVEPGRIYLIPDGYHQFESENHNKPKRLIVSPGRCYLPAGLTTWGWSVQLYATRSKESWGIGDLSDLEKLVRWSQGMGAGMLLLNPLSAAAPILPQQDSPYYPTSRRFFNPLWIHIEWVPGALGSDGLETLAQEARALNDNRRIDRNRVFQLKVRALEELWANYKPDQAFTDFCLTQGADLDRFATFCVLAEQHKHGWRSWPDEYRHPSSSAVERFARANSKRVDFHKWLQWLIDQQLARCAQHVSLMQDLPIGVDPDGADAWAWQDVFAKGMAVGAPPDEFNTQGQNWGFAPFDPHKLRAAGYEPFIQTIRAAFRRSGGLRIDHVMGLFRLFWIPEGMPAKDGAYVRYPAGEMLAIIALESQRARAYVVGEDLGTVETEARKKLATARILSYRLLWFEKDGPQDYPKNALAAITTHDLPTVAGLWTGSDLKKQHDLGLNPNDASTAEIRERLARVTEVENNCAVEDLIQKSYAFLANAPSRILTAALEDAAAVEERPNVPTTLSEKNPNWSLALPMHLDDLMNRKLPHQIAESLRRSRKSKAGSRKEATRPQR